ncbi:hypothetical protein [Moraxella lacunata]
MGLKFLKIHKNQDLERSLLSGRIAIFHAKIDKSVKFSSFL